MRREISYSEVYNCVTVRGITTFRIKITHNKLNDELYRPRFLSIRASHNTASVALSGLFHVTPCFELRASCNICNLHCFVIIYRDNTVLKKSMLNWNAYTHHLTMRTYTRSSGCKFPRIFNIGCSRRCAVSLKPSHLHVRGDNSLIGSYWLWWRQKSQTPAWKLNPTASPQPFMFFFYYISRRLSWGDTSERSVKCLSAGIHQHLLK
jgi:hypothetical protein